MAAEIPEIELTAGATDPDWQMKFNLSFEEIKLNAIGKFVGADYFKMFSYELLQGDEDELLGNMAAMKTEC